MPSAGALKRRKKLKEGFKWLKNKILDPILKKLSPLVRKFLKSKFGSSMTKFATWLNQTVIQKDKFGIMNAIKDLIPYGQYLEKAIKIAGNFIEQADWDKVGEFIEKLVYNSDKQNKVIEDTYQGMNNVTKERNPRTLLENVINQQAIPQSNDESLFMSDDDDMEKTEEIMETIEDKTNPTNKNNPQQNASNYSKVFGRRINRVFKQRLNNHLIKS